MARIAGVDLPRNKRIEIGLTYIYGIGKTSSRRILEKLNIDPNVKTDQLSDEEVSNIRKAIDDQYKVEGELRTDVSMNIKRLMDLGISIILLIPTVLLTAVIAAAIKLDSEETWPRVWPADDGGDFDSFEYPCFLTLAPMDRSDDAPTVR